MPDLRPTWTYKIEEGWIEDSMAFETATQFGVSSELIQRALELKSSIKSNQSLPRATTVLDIPSEKYSVSVLRTFLSDCLQRMPVLQTHLRTQHFTVIPFGFIPPPFLERSSCVYLLILRTASDPSQSPVGRVVLCSQRNGSQAIYIGETESIMTRLESHR